MKLDLPSAPLLRPPGLALTKKWPISLATEYSALLQKKAGTMRRRSPRNCKSDFSVCVSMRSPLDWQRRSFSTFANCLYDSTPRWRHFGDIAHPDSFVFAHLDP